MRVPQGAKLDVEATLAVVEMFINTRNVELAEDFEQKQREQGLPPNRRQGDRCCFVLFALR